MDHEIAEKATADVRIVTSSKRAGGRDISTTAPFETQMPPGTAKPRMTCPRTLWSCLVRFLGHFGLGSPCTQSDLLASVPFSFISIVQISFPFHFSIQVYYSSPGNTSQPTIIAPGSPPNRSFLFDRLQGFPLRPVTRLCSCPLRRGKIHCATLHGHCFPSVTLLCNAQVQEDAL